MLVVIARAMAFKIGVEIYTGNYFRFIIALGKYDAYVLVVLQRIAFQRIGGAGMGAGFRFAVIDFTMLHNVFHLRLCYMAAFHATPGVAGIFEKTGAAVKAAIPAYLVGSGGPGAVVIAWPRLSAGAAGAQGEHQHGQY